MPQQLGLAVHLHPEYGKKMIDILHGLECFISYGELRRFITSLATDQIDINKEQLHPTWDCFNIGWHFKEVQTIWTLTQNQ